MLCVSDIKRLHNFTLRCTHIEEKGNEQKRISRSFLDTKSNDAHRMREYFYCPKCNKEYTKYSSYRYHVKYDCGNSQFMCTYCSRIMYRKSSMKRHILKHKVDNWESYFKVMSTVKSRKVTCGYCNQIIENPEGLPRHFRERHKVLPYRCGRCGIIFDQIQLLRKHADKCKGQSLLNNERVYIKPKTWAVWQPCDKDRK
ncbi:unnamed protein product [Acanthoscelides obtectus]|uniref:C2H2-type domain-containing protein n=1 Tax=Acanthoscelides obtectus TaxID=200917 RepID=A0A9P0NYJ9_ACAOB|nr:unnamed protein product [Acanthoscelides obtectus]CAK1669664.1 Zinc finger protein 628 [Acanthoscelides obtectus]